MKCPLNLFSGHPKQPKLPLIRLRIIHPPSFETFSVQRFGHSYVSKVANTKDILHFMKKKVERPKPTEIDGEMLKNILKQEGFDKQRVEDLVKQYFEQTDTNKRLLVLSEIGVSSAVQQFVDKEENKAILALVEHQVQKTQRHLRESRVDQAELDDEIEKFREERRQNSELEATDSRAALQNRVPRRNSNEIDELFEDETVAISPPRGRGRGRARGRGSRGGRGGRGSSAANESVSSSRSTTRAVPKKTLDESASSKRKTRQTNVSSFFNSTAASSRSDVVDLSDSEDEDIVPVTKKRKTATQSKSRRGVLFDFSD